MGIWDVARLLARRWAVSVPLLLLTGAGATLIDLNVRPDYVATSYVSLLPPTIQRNPAAGQTREVNPWDVERLTDAVLVRLATNSLAKQLTAEGFKGSWEAVADENYRSVVRIEVTAHTAAQARSIAGRLVRELDDEVARQQAEYPLLQPGDKITTTRIDGGDEVVAASGRIWRAVLVVAAGGLLLTAAASLSVDAMARRRTRPRSRMAAVPAPPVMRHRPARHASAQVGAPPAASADTDATQPVVITNVPLQMPVAGAAPATHLGVGPSSDDSTIVLPFSNAPWAERKKTATLGEAEGGKASEIAQR